MNSIVEAVLKNGVEMPDKTAMVYDGVPITYKELTQKIYIFANALKVRGMKRGNRVAIEAENLLSFYIAFLGTHLAGGVVVPIERNISIYRLQDILKSTKPALVFMKNNGEDFEAFCEGISSVYEGKMPKADALATITSTTGTTGNPVLISHTNRNMVATLENLKQGTDLKQETVLFSNLPASLATGYRRIFIALYMGATAVITHKQLTEELLGEILEHDTLSYIILNSANMRMLLNIKNEQLREAIGKVKCVETVAEPLSLRNIKAFHKLYPGVTLYNVYGTTESGCVTVNNTFENPMEGCIGKPTCNAVLSIIDENGEQVTEPGIYGYIAVSGPMNMTGYYRKKALTEKVMQDGRIVMKDIGYFDEDGYYYYVSRVGDIINVNGHKVIPTEIENIAMGYEGVEDCVCSAQEDVQYGQVPILYLVCVENFDLERFFGYLSRNLEMYKVPQQIISVDKIPRTSTGKAMRRSMSFSRGV